MTDARPRSPVLNHRGESLVRVVALMNQKGGVGKTTTAVNLAAAIAELGRSVLLIDLDPQAHTTLHLGVEPSGAPTVYDLLTDDSGKITPTAAVIRSRPRLGLIPAETDLAAAETELAPAADRQDRLRRALATLDGEFEFILIDCPPSLGLLTLNGLAAAREVIVPMQAQYLALQGLGKLLETVTLVGQSVNPRLRVSGVVLCMHEETTKLSKEVVADIEQFFKEAREQDVPWRGARLYRPAIRRNIKLAEAPSFGQTIFEYAPGCPGAQDYLAIARQMVEEWDRVLARRAEAPVTPAVVVREAVPAAMEKKP